MSTDEIKMTSEKYRIVELEAISKKNYDLVIFGRGYAGITNCVTRIKTKNTKYKLPENVLIIGRQDPWSEYQNHAMGQFISLLTLPGYDTKNRLTIRNKWMQSAEFAELNQRQVESILDRHGSTIHVVNAVANKPIEYNVDEKCWEIEVTSNNGQSAKVSSVSLDICTGPGKARTFNPLDGNFTLRKPWRRDIVGKFDQNIVRLQESIQDDRIFVAENFLKHDSRKLSGHLIVVGGGPLASNVVDYGADLDQVTHVTWIMTSNQISNSFPESERFDGLLKNI